MRSFGDSSAPADKSAPAQGGLLDQLKKIQDERGGAPAPAAPAPAAPRAEVSARLTVEEGGKAAEDELDIPAFLRRQAN